jgi:hypothetical protein
VEALALPQEQEAQLVLIAFFPLLHLMVEVVAVDMQRHQIIVEPMGDQVVVVVF